MEFPYGSGAILILLLYMASFCAQKNGMLRVVRDTCESREMLQKEDFRLLWKRQIKGSKGKRARRFSDRLARSGFCKQSINDLDSVRVT